MARKPRPPSKRTGNRNAPEKGSPPAQGFVLQGRLDPSAPAAALNVREVKLKTKGVFRPGTPRDEAPPDKVSVAPDDVLEIEFEDGQRLWLSGDDYRERFAGQIARGAEKAPVLAAPDRLDMLPAGMQARGPVSWAVKALKVLGVDLAKKGALELAKSLDDRASTKGGPGLGLHRCDMDSGAFALQSVNVKEVPPDRPMLVFIHGTASSTWGSFGDLWSEARRSEREALLKTYDGEVFAFEHRSLTESPIRNALDLAEALPEGARLHLVTHSRGGLVGELLCRANVVRTLKKKARKGAAAKESEAERTGHPFQPEEFDLLARDEACETFKQDLETLNAELIKKAFFVERFVRVACPALGTTLASGRLDRWLSVIGTLGATALPNTPLSDTFNDLGDFMAAVIKQRTDPSELPGLAAMMPESAFIQLVNWPKAPVPGDLTVIAGDIEPDAWWAKLLVLISDRFYDGDHDLVVNTASMYGGVRRSGEALASFHRSPTTNHFTYFRNPDSAAQIVRALTRPAGDTAGFEPLVRPTISIARTVASRAFKPQPVVFVLPGIMGSELQVGDDLVWADVGDLIFGGMRKIRIEAKDVTPRGIMGRYYGELVAYLLASHNVVPFPYDWRIAVETEADRLAKDIRSFHEAAKGQGQPVRILAHSMGGLLARTLIARHPDLWRDICAHPGARLVMLGTPNGGSHAITELLVGQSAILRNLALIDIAHSKEEMLGILARFPGMLAMLPRSDGEDYFSARTWSAYHAQAGRGWVLPLERDLARAAELRRLLDSAPIDPQRTCYVAGSADATADGMYYDSKADAIRFMATARGDGRVTWDSGIPPGVPTWYMGAAHGDLAACEEAFEGLRELLDKGTTALLPRTPPVTRAAVEHFPLPSAGDELYPDQEVLTATALGARPRRQRPAKPIEPKVRVRVLHGDLAFARYPVAVGHYAGDTIISAEKALDLALDGRLSRRHQVGLYPGAVETCAVFANPRLRTSRDATPKGAIVVGLGRVGELSAASLNRSFARALLEYALQWKELVPETAGEADRPQGKVLGISSLLIGTGAGGVGVAEVVLAMLQAVLQTNRTLADTGQPVRIGVVELIELWEDRAIQAVAALERYGQTSQLRDTIAFEGEGAVVSAKGGLRRVTFEEPGGWWERLQILGGPREGECGEPGLRFVTMTRRARNEIRTLSTQRALVDRFIEQSIGTTQDNRTVARTLFDLLLPNELKEQALDQDHLVLLVDAESARYPWELLEDRWSPNGRPFAVEHGLLRQLATHTFRESVQAAVENNALVVGDPLSAFPELKGAQQEAEAVCRKLRTDGRFDVTRHIRPSVDQVIHALFAKPYRVLHLAGHGVYRYRPESDLVCRACGGQLPPQMQPTPTGELVTGMVIGDGVFLTPREVHQMRRIPELVFINCCHLGHVTADERRDFHQIAANLATEFINNGVRAVIAAGWAVDDAAADTFAISFYDALLSGRTLGDAVQSARRETFELHANTNTWGAYQCYGDPGYRLITEIVLQENPKPETFYSPNAAIAALDNLRARLSTMAGQSVEGELTRLEAIRSVLEGKRWLNQGRVCAALAAAYGEADRFDDALGFYRDALKAEDAGLSFEDYEQLANLMARAAVAQPEPGEPRKSTQERMAGIDEAIGLLEWLCRVPVPGSGGRAGPPEEGAPGATVERLSLLGSAYKRKALLSAKPVDALAKMRESYEKAYLRAQATDRPEHYPLLNRLAAEIVLDWYRAEGKKPQVSVKEVRRQLDASRSGLQIRYDQQPEFWDAVMRVECDLLEALVSDKPAQTLIALQASYAEIRKLASPREFASAMDQLEFFRTMAEKAPEKEAKALGKQIAALQSSLKATE